MPLPRLSAPRAGRLLLLGAAALLPAACMNPMSPMPAAPVRVAQASEVGSCHYIANINDQPGLYGQLATQGQEYARKAILDDAANAGANTVVFEKVEPGALVTNVRATAYRC